MQVFADDDCFAIRLAARYTSQLYDRHLGQVGLTITQFSILSRVERNDCMTMKQLADAMLLERTTLVRAIQPLQRDGLLTSRKVEAKGRGLSLSLTPAGEARLAAARIHWGAAQQDFERRFGVERAALLRRELFDMTKA